VVPIAVMSKALKRSKSSEPAPSVADLQTEIRERGMRSTGPRVAVLAHLNKASSPLSHTEIYESLADRGYDRATIYRNLMDLAEAGLLMRSDLGDHVWRFERKRATAGHSAGHPHFVCTDCGEVSCLPDLSVTVVAASGAPKSLGTKRVEVQVKGVCDDCI
jgi:Fur family transcriptional regulator, ferric uptake regulator